MKTSEQITLEIGQKPGHIAEILNECYPDSHETWNTGGGCIVEVWRTPTRALWTLTDEYVGLHSSDDAFWGDEQAGGLVYSIGRGLENSLGDALLILTQIENEAFKGYANRTPDTVTVWDADRN
jgi:hypothetical protein